MKHRPRLAASLEQDLRDKIRAGQPPVGERLPTERVLCESYGVSRTVVREAIAGLRSSGLIESRRGSGLFVRSDKPVSLSSFGSMPGLSAEIVAIVDSLELRAAVEVEAAFLAATRASPGQIERIRYCQRQFTDALLNGKETESADFQFHQAIAEATNNGAYQAFMDYLGHHTIPRSKLGLELNGEACQSYLADLQVEHENILIAIESHSAEQARQAMKAHLFGSLERYRALSRH